MAALNLVTKPEILNEPDHLATSEATSHILVTLRPKIPDRFTGVMAIETDFLRDFVHQAWKQQEAKKQVSFYNLISGHPWLSGSKGYIFEKFVKDFLIDHPTSKGLQCTARDPTMSQPLDVIPVCKSKQIFDGKTKLGDVTKLGLEFPSLWLPASKIHAFADALIFTEKHIISIQATVSARHTADPAKLKVLENAIPKQFQEQRSWCHVFVTDREFTAESLRKQKLKLPEHVNVYSSVLNVAKVLHNQCVKIV
jgi:hypothetical protein